MSINSKKEHFTEVLQHLVKHSNNKTIGKTKIVSNLKCCTECAFVGKSEHGVRIHKGKAHSTEKEANKPEQLDQSELIILDNTLIFNCPTCNFKFTDKNVLEDHIHNSHQGKQTQNSVSPTNIILLNKATEIKDDTNPSHKTKTALENECKDCDQSFAKYDLFNKHITTHRKLNIGGTPGVKFCCEFCDYKIVASPQIRKHMTEKHNTGHSVFSNTPLLKPQEEPCDGSNGELQAKNILGKRNSRIMESSDCDVCGETTTNERELRHYMARKHITDRDFV